MFNIYLVFILAFCDIGYNSFHIFSRICWYFTVTCKEFKVQLKLNCIVLVFYKKTYLPHVLFWGKKSETKMEKILIFGFMMVDSW